MSSNNFGYVGTAEVQKIGENEGVFSTSEALELINTDRGGVPIVATGGSTSSYTNNVNGKTYKVHTFTSSGTFQITSGSGVVTYVVLAGGGVLDLDSLVLEEEELVGFLRELWN